MSQINFLEETIDTLQHHGKTWADVKWVGKKDGTIKIHPEYFLEIANKNYDNGFGGNEVNLDIVVVGDTWWLERWEYDGSEGWSFKSPPILQPGHNLGKGVFVNNENYEDDWEVMTNLEYLEWEHAKQEPQS